MSRLSIDIADDLLLALREHPQEMAREMRIMGAIHYFQSRRLSLGQAARLAGMQRLDFLDVLNTHGVPAFDLSADDALAEMAAARRQVSHPDHELMVRRGVSLPQRTSRPDDPNILQRAPLSRCR